MASIATRPLTGQDLKIRIDHRRFNTFLSSFDDPVTFDVAPIRPLGTSDTVGVQTGKSQNVTLTGWQWADEQQLDDVVDDWRTHNHQHDIQVYPKGETMPAVVKYLQVVASDASESATSDGVQTLTLSGVQSGEVERFEFVTAQSDLSDNDWLWTLSNGHLQLVDHRNTVSEPHLGPRAVTGLSASTRKVAIHYTLKAISGFGSPFMTENDSRWQLGWYDRAEPAGQTFFEPITEYEHITNGNNFQALIFADPPTRLANNDLAFKFDLAPINTPDHQTYAFDLRKSVSVALLD